MTGKPGPKPRPLEERLFSKVDAHGVCWEWTARLNEGGYGTFKYQGRSVLAHRIVWEYLYGVVPPPMLDHRCRNRRCVNPDHLEPVTHLENTRRGGGPHRRTLCHKGHPLYGANMFYEKRSDGGIARRCKVCHRERQTRQKLKSQRS